MKKSLFPSDDELPTWLHTLLCILVTMPFFLPLAWKGVAAIATKHLEPLPGPDFGQYFFGNQVLDGTPAVHAGISLLLFGVSILAIGFSYTRIAAENLALRVIPWLLLAASGVISFLVPRS